MDEKVLFHIEGSLEDYYKNKVSSDFSRETRAKTWKEAERNVVYNVKKELGYTKDMYVRLRQTEEQKKRSWKEGSV